MSAITITSQGNFVGGRWQPRSATFESSYPADIRHVVGAFGESLADVDIAVGGARAVQPTWAGRSLGERIDVLRAFRDELDADRERIAACIVSEVGKTRPEAEAEIAAVLGKFDITIRLAPAELAPIRPEGVDGYAEQRPLGVFAVIGPFNFPVHLSNGHIVPALVAGNAVVLKPSSTAPGCAELYVRAWDRAASRCGAPGGALALVQGAGNLGALLASHPGVDAVAFTGSYDVGVAIRRACAHQTAKLLALEMGGKNTAIVLADADVPAAAAAIGAAACGLAGQRCTATSRVVVDDVVADELLSALRDQLAAVRVGDPFDPATTLGPLATEPGRDRFVAAQSDTAGLDTVVAGGATSGPAPGYWVSPAMHRVDDRNAARRRIDSELFGPELLVEQVASIDEAVSVANDTPFGLAMSVHTRDEGTFRALLPRLETGLLNLNRGTAGASSALPFGGIKHSGNHRPAGSWSIRYCVRPVSVLTS